MNLLTRIKLIIDSITCYLGFHRMPYDEHEIFITSSGSYKCEKCNKKIHYTIDRL